MENQINTNAFNFNVHNEIINIIKNHHLLFVNDDETKMSFLKDNIENMSLNAVKQYLKKDDDSLLLFNDELITEMNNLADGAKALQTNKVFKNPAMQGILKKQLMSLQKEYTKLLLKIVTPIYQQIGEHIEVFEDEDFEDFQESSEPENEKQE